MLEKETDNSLSIFSTATEIAEQYPKFQLIYDESWKGEESYPEFICDVLQHLAAIGKAKLGILSVDGEPAAAQIWFKIGLAWGVFKLAYRPQFRRYSVGTLLTASMIECLFTESMPSEIDFLSGDDAYKRDWVGQKREHFGMELIGRSNIYGRALGLKRRFIG